MTDVQNESLVSRIVEKSVQYLMEQFSLDMETAFNFVYNSKIFQSLIDPETALRARSADYIFELIKEEYQIKCKTLEIC